ncbi:MAG: anthranilate phosphoribosyltransferase [Actinobacteria bacterium]|nr:anthranilate phosphoribosyltransferase [Actinomycetota bacterium]
MLLDMLEKVMKSENLTKHEAYESMKLIMDGKVNDCQIAAFLTALKMKGESIEEVSGFSWAMLEKANKVVTKHKTVVDTCGTGGDKKNTFNISTTSAFIAAGAGVVVAKHGNRSVSSLSGSADVLEELGVKIDLDCDKVGKCIDRIGIGFIFAPSAHKAMKYVAKARKEMGIKTVFNILGPITNPAMANGRVLGVFDEKLMDVMVHSLKNLGVKRAFVVYGLELLDELSVSESSLVSELNDGKVSRYVLNPSDLGFKKYSIEELRGGDAKENARILFNILSGNERGARRDCAVLNAAAAIVAGGKASNLSEAIGLAENSINSGRALDKLNRLIEFTNRV